MRVAAAVVVLSVLLGHAPLQCGSEPEHSLRRYESPAEALYGLAERFQAKGDEDGRRETLQYLVAKYPNSRFAQMAKDDLNGTSGAKDEVPNEHADATPPR